MAIYTVTAVQHSAEVRRWSETDKRRACRLARDVARDFGATLDDVFVQEAGGRLVYHLRRIPDGDGLAWCKTHV